MTTLTIQPSSKDGDIEQYFPTTNFGTLTLAYVQAYTGYACRVLAEFPITWGVDIPAGATLTAATVSLYYDRKSIYDPVGRTYWAERVLRTDWVEAQATWNIYKTSNNWTTAGCGSDGNDYTSTGQASSAVPAAAAGWMSWNVLTQVQAAQTGSINPIFRIKDGTEISVISYWLEFLTREYAVDTSLRPKLVIDYTPAGWAHISKVNAVAAASISKINSVPVANIAKINGIAV